MMASKRTLGYVDPLVHSKVPRLETRADHGIATGLCNPGTLHGYSPEYSGTYFTYCLKDQDGADLPVQWSSPGAYLQNGRNSIVHPLAAERPLTNGLIFRSEPEIVGQAFHTEKSSPVLVQDRIANDKWADFVERHENLTHSPNAPGLHAPMALRKLAMGNATGSPQSEHSAVLAVPKPVYRNRVCCTDPGCKSRMCFSIDTGADRVPGRPYEGEWRSGSGLCYAPLSPMEKRNGLFEPGVLQLEQGSGCRPHPKDAGHGGFPSSRQPGAMKLPTFAERDYNSLSYDGPSRPLPIPPTKSYRSIRPASKIYHDMSQSPPKNYHEMQRVTVSHSHMPPPVYQPRSPVSKYPQLHQRHVYLCPQGGLNIEKAASYKDLGLQLMGDASPKQPSTRNAYPATSEQYLFHTPPPPYSAVSMPYSVVSAGVRNAPSQRDYELPYSGYKVPLSPGHKGSLPEGCGTHIRMDFADCPVDCTSQNLQVMPPHNDLGRYRPATSAFQPVRASYRLENPAHIVPKDASVARQTMQEKTSNNLLEDQSSCRIGLHKERSIAPLGKNRGVIAEHGGQKTNNNDDDDNNNNNNNNNSSKLSSKGGAGSPIIIDSPPRREHKSSSDLYEVTVSKRNKEKMSGKEDQNAQDGGNTDKSRSPSSPLMPVINNVFSLAPYKAYLEASGILSFPYSEKEESSPCSRQKTERQASESYSKQETERPASRSSPITGRDSCKRETEAKNEAADWGKRESKQTVCDTRQPTAHFDLKADKSNLMQPNLDGHVVEGEMVGGVRMNSQDTVLDLSVKKPGSQSKLLTDNISDYKTGDRAIVHEKRETLCNLERIEKRDFQTVVSTPTSESPVSSSTTTFMHKKFQVLKPAPTKLVVTPPPLQNTNNEPSPTVEKHLSVQSLKLPTFKLILPDLIKTVSPRAPEVSPSLSEADSSAKTNKHSHRYFMELHQSLNRLIANSMSHTPEEELKGLLAKMEEDHESISVPSKTKNISRILEVLKAPRGKEVWLKSGEIASALSCILSQLEIYIYTKNCPFPHVIRAGTIFIPMVVVKETLFPQLQGCYIDQVLQEHRVELRPTTLSEERLLTQLQQRCCSSKLRRLLSLKQLPTIYPDLLSLYYHDCVHKHLDAEFHSGLKREWGEPPAEKTFDQTMKREHSQTGHQLPNKRTPGGLKSRERGEIHFKRKRKGRRKNGLNRTFVGKGNEDSELDSNKEVRSDPENSTNAQESCHKWDKSEMLEIKLEEASSEEVEMPEGKTGISSCNEPEVPDVKPLRVDQEASKSPMVVQKSCSGLVLKLKRVLFKSKPRERGQKYCPEPDSGIKGQLSSRGEEVQELQHPPNPEEPRGKVQPDVPQQKKREAGAAETLRPTRSTSKVLHLRSSMVQIKFHRLLAVHRNSLHHSARRRRRGVRRPAVQRVRPATEINYPALVGKRIRHLYEEKDKSEVWYHGVVVRVHEEHSNPLKTVYEVQYDSEPEWQYYLELLQDYKKGWLKVED
ncbi:hypothetical protein HHUSO_G23114 [Huso huso]|uniref:Uncharacterized protein n=1 Tax=Huso huso TaxID=61971 RepID=A0ABR0YW69_HUSHU